MMVKHNLKCMLRLYNGYQQITSLITRHISQVFAENNITISPQLQGLVSYSWYPKKDNTREAVVKVK